MIEQREVSKVFGAALATAKRRGDWAQVARNFGCVVDRVSCNLHFRAQMHWQRRTQAARVSGECVVYVSNASDMGLVGGSGWVTFAFSESSVQSAWRLYEIALAEALAELRASPEFRALADQAEMSEEVREPHVPLGERPRFRL